jgi:FG-GAP-like repeat
MEINHHFRKFFTLSLICITCCFVALSACGGGGGSSAITIPTAPATPATPIAVQPTSYLNAKSTNFGQAKLPIDPYTGVAHTFADFKRNGEYQLFVATVGYDAANPNTFINRGTFKFYTKQGDGTYVQNSTILANNAGCLHPRKAIVADFNQDGRPDVFVSCTGIDVTPFSGEKSAFILSNADGTYVASYLNFDAYAHGASAADLNGDGYPDLIVTDTSINLMPFVLINNRNGTFTKRTDLIPSNLKFKLIYSAELIDFNKDGKMDLLLAGHEWDDIYHANIPASIYLGNGTADFSSIVPTTLPTVANEGITLDMVFNNNDVYLLRTSLGDGTFYKSTVIQKIAYPSLTDSVIYNSNRAMNNGFAWAPWMVMANGRLIATSDKYSFSVAP